MRPIILSMAFFISDEYPPNITGDAMTTKSLAMNFAHNRWMSSS